MDSQAGNERNRLGEVNQSRRDIALTVLKVNSASNRKIAIKPGVKQRTAVNFDAKLQVSVLAHFRIGFDLQTRAVGVRTRHSQTAGGNIFTTGSEGDQGRIVTRYVVGPAPL